MHPVVILNLIAARFRLRSHSLAASEWRNDLTGIDLNKEVFLAVMMCLITLALVLAFLVVGTE